MFAFKIFRFEFAIPVLF